VAAGIPGARLGVIDGSGHTPHLEQPDRFMRLVDEALHDTAAA
jgi:pimeloyl-ACP methyl ester carboxylesterase